VARVRAHSKQRGPRHTIFLARKYSDGAHPPRRDRSRNDTTRSDNG
jgi:hypothetical protein